MANEYQELGGHDSAAGDSEAARVLCDCLAVATRTLMLAVVEGMGCTRLSQRPDENLLPEAAKIGEALKCRGGRQEAEQQGKGLVYL